MNDIQYEWMAIHNFTLIGALQPCSLATCLIPVYLAQYNSRLQGRLT